MKPYIGKIESGLKVRVGWYDRPEGWTEYAIYEIEEIVGVYGFPMIKFKGYNLLHDKSNLIFYEI